MINKNKKAFTLVELIIVITILSIIATIAFISFGWQTAKAYNTKVTSDISNITAKVNILTLNSGKSSTTFQGTWITVNTLASGIGAGIDLTNIDSKYKAGQINFFELKEDRIELIK